MDRLVALAYSIRDRGQMDYFFKFSNSYACCCWCSLGREVRWGVFWLLLRFFYHKGRIKTVDDLLEGET